MWFSSHKTVTPLLTSFAILFSVSTAQATLGPPVKIKMAADTKAAVFGQLYEGVFEVHVLKPGQLAGLKLLGEGWSVVEFQTPAEQFVAEPGVIRVPFKAIPADADRPIGLSLTFNGRPVKRTYEIGPAYFAQAGKPKPSLRTPSAARGGSCAGGGPDTIRCTGRIYYVQPDGREVGADRIDVQVLDVDDDADDEIWSGWTDENGFFDTGVRPIPGDFNGSAPDLRVYYETETGGWVDVTDHSLFENTYWWETDEIENFEGDCFDFGSFTPAATSLHPAIHIFNTMTRARRFILENPGYGTREVQVEWPSDETSYLDDEIQVAAENQWQEDVQLHEYGHHFMDGFYESPEPNYCLDPSCDPNPSEEDCSHCLWCQETDHDAFSEGWPDWLADVGVRAFADRYQFDNGDPYEPILRGDHRFETPLMCFDSNMFESAISTEGFVAALLRDIEDAEQDDHNGDGIFDLLCLGPNPNFTVLDNHHPITVLDFINGFLADFPQHAGAFRSTAFNVGGSAYGGFPADAQPPGVVPAMASPSHPQGVGGPLPCITIEFDAAPDDATGACQYSAIATRNPAGLDPGENAGSVSGADECRLTMLVPTNDIGVWYISIKAQDNAGNWSSQWSTFGPFEVTDCNGTGILDVCDISCFAEGIPGCQIAGLCAGQPGCGLSEDCQPNLVPDECDLAEGTSEDCNVNEKPDECEPMKHWKSGDATNPTWWHLGTNWEEGSAPAFSDEVCIAAGLPTPLLRQNTYTVGTLACYQGFSIVSAGAARLTLLKPSFILDDLTMTSGVLTVNDELIISGSLNWSGGRLEGSGQTTVTGGASITSSATDINFQTLNLQCDTVASGGLSGNDFTIRNFAGRTYDCDGTSITVADGNAASLFINEGTFVKSAGAGSTRFGLPVNNSGEMRVEAGTLHFSSNLTGTGSMVGLPGTTLEFSGVGAEPFPPGSSLMGDHVKFTGSSVKNIRGTYDADIGTTIATGSNVTFAAGADVVDYGDHLVASGGTAHFEAFHGAPIIFQSITGGNVYFDSGDPIVTETLTLGGIWGENKDVTVNGLLTWNNAGSFFESGVINANGSLVVASGTSQKNLECVLNNAGTATILGNFGVLTGSQVNNMPTGVWDIQVDGTVINGQQTVFNNAGTLLKSAGAGTATIGTGAAIRPPISNSGIVEVRSGVLAFSRSDYTQTAGQTVLNGGGLSMTGTSPGPVQINGGVLTGVGTITGTVNNTGGSVEPGLSPGQLNVTGNYTQGAAAALEIELAGLVQGTGHDWLNVTGAASLDGTLRVGLLGGFAPAIGEQFVILTAASVSGTFAMVESLTLGLEVDVIYGPTAVTLEITAAPVPGDCDDDGDADLDDYGLFPGCLNGPAIPYGSPGCDCIDFDVDGAIDLRDFAGFQEAFTG